MPTFEIKIKSPIRVQGDFVDAGLSVQVSTMWPNPFDDSDKIQNAFLRLHGIDFRAAGYLNPGYFSVETL